MANQVRVGVGVTGAKGASSELDKFRDKFKKLQEQGAKGLAIGAGINLSNRAINGVTDAVKGTVDEIFHMVDAASDLNETLSKSKVVFGGSATGVEEWGKTAAMSFGLSKQAAIEAAASFGNVFKGVGIAEQKAADMSEGLVKLAGDLASFNNIDPTEALDKLRSGLAGESEPLRSVGVFLTEAQVKAKAMQLGLAGAHGELTEGAKILARYQLILDQTGTAQGDFARTSDGLANSQRILSAKLKDTEAELGQKLIPIFTEINRVALLAFDKTAMSLDDLKGAMAAGSQAAAREFDKISRVASATGLTVEKVWELAGQGVAVNAEAMRAASAKVADELRDLSLEARDAAAATGQLSGAFDKNVAHAEATQKHLDELAGAAKDTQSAIDGLTSAVDEGLFGKAITAGHEAQLKDNIRDLEKQRDAVKKGSLKWLELTGQIAENRQALFDLHLEQAAKEGPKAAIDFLKRERTHAGEAKDEIDKLITKYQLLAEMQGSIGPIIPFGNTGPKSVAHKHATGGFGAPGELSLVGENGPELRVEGNRGSTYIPLDGSAPATAPMLGGGPITTIPIPVPMNWTPAMQAAWAREAGPAMVDYLRQRRLI